MSADPADVLTVLDRCCDSYDFPMLDNGYVYPAAARLSLFRSPADWAVVIETFGHNMRAGLPNLNIATFASRLHARNRPEDYVSREAYDHYLFRNPNNESRFFYPVGEGDWQDPESLMLVAAAADRVPVRGRAVPLPRPQDYAAHGVDLEEPPRVQVFELCRYLAAVARDDVLATTKERRVSVLPGMEQVLVLDDWRHPDLVNDERPGGSETFRQLARVLATGDVAAYRPTEPPNTHWRNWPEGGRL